MIAEVRMMREDTNDREYIRLEKFSIINVQFSILNVKTCGSCCTFIFR